MPHLIYYGFFEDNECVDYMMICVGFVKIKVKQLS